MRYECRPRGPWAGPKTTHPAPSYRFRAPWTSTLTLLARETELLGAKLVVLQVDLAAGDVRLDGMPRATARAYSPGVRISFDSRHGPLTYSSDAYDDWRANVRAIALALEALRAVDRYGVSRRGEQYTGWAALPAGAPAGQMSADDAARLLAGYAEDITAGQILTDRDARARAYKRGALQLHPDRGGDPAALARLSSARDLLDLVDERSGGGVHA
jgi:hypothetical protein